MNKEVEELLDKLGSMEDAPLIWINKRAGNLITENQQLKDRIDKALDILHNINEDLPLDLILTEIEHTEYVLKGDKE